MTTEGSRVSSAVDLTAKGKQQGFLNVPHSRDESAWGTLRLPITVVAGGSGPTVLFTGGNHGDEYEGVVALLKLARALEPERMQGRAIILPALNLPAVRAGRRLSPIDGKNMNRVFPGARDGTITEVIAHYVYSELLPRADTVVDIHSGGKSMALVPAAVMHRLADKKREAETMALLKVFGAPIGLVIEELDSSGMLDGAVEDMGKIFLSTELGGGGTLTVETVAIAETGALNVLKHLGILAGEPETREARGLEPTRLMDVPDTDCYVVAGENGLYEPFVELGGSVEEGAPVGQIHFVEVPEREPQRLHASRSGTVICRRVPGETEIGDTVAVIAQDY